MVLKNFFKVTPEKRQVKIKAKKGVVYSNPRWWKKIIFYFGSSLVVFSLAGILYIYEPIMVGWINYKSIDQNQVNNKIEEIKKDAVVNTNAPEPIVDIDEPEEFYINIPKIGAEAKIQADVSISDKEEYMLSLKKNIVAQALGSAFPGEGDGKTMFLFAHSSEQGVLDARDNPVFYLLGKLENDDVILINYRGEIFTYRVYTKKVVKSKETDYLNYSESGKEILILQTCWPIGTNWQRLLVFAEKI